MSFDKATRNALAKLVSDCRRLLTADIRDQLQRVYGLQPDGTALPLGNLQHLDEHGLEIARELRIWQDHLVTTEHGADQKRRIAAFDRLAQETAFTALNRLGALRLCEERGHILECVRRGKESDGFALYERLSGGALGTRGDTYRQFLQRVFDELAQDLGVLFDRRQPQSLVFPGERCLEEVLTLLNNPALQHLWQEDETIGWIYQYYNSQEERRQMREESAAPRNSRELAVRNQFFTPRYVVEFLTDNTLGRIWYEMTKGTTSLKDRCHYLVRRPNELFLGPGEDPPPSNQEEDTSNRSQEELLKEPVHIPHRALKDPREIRLLDPACGSMHFGLYAFDLFEVIYEEVWDKHPELLADLRRAITDKREFLILVPKLIIEHNLHGIEIDPRCTQIAGLSLWLRAQKTWQRLGLRMVERPRIAKSNIVCAEPMPGEKELLREFTGRLDSPAIGQLVEMVFDKMQLAGEAGSLLKIEEEIQSAVAEAKALWKQGPRYEQVKLFGDIYANPEQQELKLDLSGITDEQFWEKAEERIYTALRDYAEQAQNGSGYQRRLFAEDAAQGFAFIDLCRKRYDVVLMNPPFGEASEGLLAHLENRFSDINKNLLCAFLKQGYEMLLYAGRLGAIYDRTAVVKNTYEPFRRTFLVSDCRLAAQVDLGWEVLDANVEATASVVGKDQHRKTATFFDSRREEASNKGEALLTAVAQLREGRQGAYYKLFEATEFSRFPNAVLGHDFPSFVVRLFATLPNFAERGVQVIQGHTILAGRFFRYWWEVPLEDAFKNGSKWQRFYNGGDYCRFYSALCDAVLYGNNAELIANHHSTILRNTSVQQKGKVGFGKRGDFIDAHVLPAGFVSSVEGQAVLFHGDASPFSTLALLNSHLFQAVINLYCGQHKYPGYVHLFPCADWKSPHLARAAELAYRIFSAKNAVESADETNPQFLQPRTTALWDADFRTEVASVRTLVANAEADLNENVSKAYSLDSEAQAFVASATSREPSTGGLLSEDVNRFWAEGCVSYCLGGVLGRWDLRFATGEKKAIEMPDPFAPLPVCPPGQLQNGQGLPAASSEVPATYPVRISWPGILVDDPNHREDIERRAREVLEVIWKERAEAIEHEACEILGMRSLREYFSKPNGFFADHLKRYSKSRRQAPIYWPLSTASGSYTVWVYYHRLTEDFLYTVVNDYVGPKLVEIERRLAQIETDLQRAAGREATRLREVFAETKSFIAELQDLKAELLRLAALPYKPNLNDGVLITAAPLWKLFRLPKWRNDLKECWEQLEAGDFDWAHLAYTIWPERVQEKCKRDRSLAIAHGVETLCETRSQEESPGSRRKRKAKAAAPTEF